MMKNRCGNMQLNNNLSLVKNSFVWGVNPSDKNPDNLKSSGFYTTNNMPDLLHDNGYLLVLALNENRVLQINTNFNVPSISIRSYWHGTWYAWKTISVS